MKGDERERGEVEEERERGSLISMMLGIPFGITIDFDTVQDKTVTVRERDSMQQVPPSPSLSPFLPYPPILY